MKLSLKWLNEYVPVSVPAPELAMRLTMAGFEVVRMSRASEGLNGICVALIKASVQHPNADKLSVTQVDAGASGVLQIVCGAKNYKVGDKVPLATVGTTLPNGLEIKKAQLRGVDSFGMLCSARELGLSQDHDGLLILDPALPVGMPVAKALGLDDTVFDVNVPTNRPDVLCHLGLAREVSAIMGAPLTLPQVTLFETGGAASDVAKVSVEAPERCPRYAARIIEGVKVGPSPQWLQERLKACGVASVNNVADVINYVLLELGHPLHAFDLDKLVGAEIVVRTAKPGEKLTTIDGLERNLDGDDLIVADKIGAKALAGVVGGRDSEVTETTTRVLLESAWYEPSSVRRSARRHGLQTALSHRFGSGADVEAVTKALDRAAALISEVGGASVLRGALELYQAKIPANAVALRPGAMSRLLGGDVPEADVHRILAGLGFTPTGDAWSVPTWRVDVACEEDLIEEVARIRGYENIPVAVPRGPSALPPEPTATEVDRRIRSALAGSGFIEVVNDPFAARSSLEWLTVREYEALGKPVEAITLKNPLSADQSLMRTSMYPGLLQALSDNERQHNPELLRLYEWGRTYVPDSDGGEDGRPVARETLRVSGVLVGPRAGRHSSAPDATVDFFDAKGIVEAILSVLGIQQARFVDASLAPYHPRASAKVWLENGVTLGTLGELHPMAARSLGLPAGVFLFELEVERLRKISVLRPKPVNVTSVPS